MPGQTPPEAMSETEAAAELAELARAIAAADAAYYQEDAPHLSDAEYDALRLRNAELEAAFPHLRRTDSPSEQVGAAPSGTFAKARHAEPMLSLDNAFSDEDVADFLGRVRRFLGLDEDTPVPTTASPMRTASSCARPRAATARKARMLPPMPAPSPISRRH